jgi:predicted NBD/HSP70 family sugar kinase
MPSTPVARPDAIRRHNLGLLLTQVHHDGELTRAELTQRLGLSRSTIGALVADLADLGLLDERVPNGGARAGRPSHVVAPRADGPYAIAVDVDITHITAAAVGIGGTAAARHSVPCDPDDISPERIGRMIVDAVPRLQTQLAPSSWPVGIGVSVPGTVDRHSGMVEFAPNLGWRHEAFGAILAGLAPAGLPVWVGNDADLGVLAEHRRGVGRGCDDVIYVIGRIGVGAGIIANGQPLRGHDGLAGESGHNVVDASGPECHCGKRGCVETYIGDHALLQLAGRPEPPTPERVAAVFDDARAGDERASTAVRDVAESLGRTVAHLVNIFDPQRVIIGGSLSGVLALAGELIQESLERYGMDIARRGTQLCQPGLAADSALLGAAELAFAQLLDDPVAVREPERA